MGESIPTTRKRRLPVRRLRDMEGSSPPVFRTTLVLMLLLLLLLDVGEGYMSTLHLGRTLKALRARELEQEEEQQHRGQRQRDGLHPTPWASTPPGADQQVKEEARENTQAGLAKEKLQSVSTHPSWGGAPSGDSRSEDEAADDALGKQQQQQEESANAAENYFGDATAEDTDPQARGEKKNTLGQGEGQHEPRDGHGEDSTGKIKPSIVEADTAAVAAGDVGAKGVESAAVEAVAPPSRVRVDDEDEAAAGAKGDVASPPKGSARTRAAGTDSAGASDSILGNSRATAAAIVVDDGTRKPITSTSSCGGKNGSGSTRVARSSASIKSTKAAAEHIAPAFDDGEGEEESEGDGEGGEENPDYDEDEEEEEQNVEVEVAAIREILSRRAARDLEVQRAAARAVEAMPDAQRERFEEVKAFAFGGEEEEGSERLSREEAAALDTVAICGDKDGVVLAFLRHSKFDVKKAKESMRRCCKWRRENKADDIFKRAVSPAKMRKHRTHWPTGFHKVDRAGRPVFYDRVGQSDLSKLRMDPDGLDQDEMVKIFTQNMEARRRFVLTRFSREAGHPVDQMTTVLDLTGLSMRHMSKEAVSYTRRISDVFQDNYSGMTCSLLVLNAPWIFSKGWQVIESFLSEDTVAKVKVLGKGEAGLKQLEEYIPKENIPDFLGGESPATIGPSDPLWADVDGAVRSWASGGDPFLDLGEVEEVSRRISRERAVARPARSRSRRSRSKSRSRRSRSSEAASPPARGDGSGEDVGSGAVARRKESKRHAEQGIDALLHEREQEASPTATAAVAAEASGLDESVGGGGEGDRKVRVVKSRGTATAVTAVEEEEAEAHDGRRSKVRRQRRQRRRKVGQHDEAAAGGSRGGEEEDEDEDEDEEEEEEEEGQVYRKSATQKDLLRRQGDRLVGSALRTTDARRPRSSYSSRGSAMPGTPSTTADGADRAADALSKTRRGAAPAAESGAAVAGVETASRSSSSSARNRRRRRHRAKASREEAFSEDGEESDEYEDGDDDKTEVMTEEEGEEEGEEEDAHYQDEDHDKAAASRKRSGLVGEQISEAFAILKGLVPVLAAFVTSFIAGLSTVVGVLLSTVDTVFRFLRDMFFEEVEVD